MTKSDSFDVTILLDRSGSMQSVRSDMEGALAKFIGEQAALPGKCALSVYLFDTEFDCQFSAVPVKDAPPVKLEPRGWTALLDAMARAIDATGARLAAMPEKERPQRVIFTVITDGMENASREFNMQSVRERVERQTKDYKWEFAFLGAGLDSFAQGGALGVNLSANYTSSPVGVKHAVGVYAASLSNSRSTGATMDFASDLTVADENK